METEFAPAQRTSKNELLEYSQKFYELPFVKGVLDAMPQIVFLLNENRQILYANSIFFDIFGIASLDDVLGLRPGEAVDCVHASKSEGGCGTTPNCKYCGAVLAILKGLGGEEAVNECNIIRKADGAALNLRVKAVPFDMKGENYLIVSAEDLGHQKQLRMLEKIFFHDVLNTACGIEGISRLLTDMISDENSQLKEMINALLDGITELADEIRSQRDLKNAVNNDLVVKPVKINTSVTLQILANVYSHFMEEKRCSVVIEDLACNTDFVSDKTLLIRVLGNLIKNAIEASGEDEKITLGCSVDDNQVRLWVHNSTVMPDEVRLQIFQRSFSTRSSGRGLGTFSVKFLTERFLKGSVEFVSNNQAGTIFYITLPMSLN